MFKSLLWFCTASKIFQFRRRSSAKFIVSASSTLTHWIIRLSNCLISFTFLSTSAISFPSETRRLFFFLSFHDVKCQLATFHSKVRNLLRKLIGNCSNWLCLITLRYLINIFLFFHTEDVQFSNFFFCFTFLFFLFTTFCQLLQSRFTTRRITGAGYCNSLRLACLSKSINYGWEKGKKRFFFCLLRKKVSFPRATKKRERNLWNFSLRIPGFVVQITLKYGEYQSFVVEFCRCGLFKSCWRVPTLRGSQLKQNGKARRAKFWLIWRLLNLKTFEKHGLVFIVTVEILNTIKFVWTKWPSKNPSLATTSAENECLQGSWCGK